MLMNIVWGGRNDFVYNICGCQILSRDCILAMGTSPGRQHIADSREAPCEPLQDAIQYKCGHLGDPYRGCLKNPTMLIPSGTEG